MKKIIVFLFAAFLIMSFTAVLGCGDDQGQSTSGESPKEVAHKYMEASVNLDVDTAYSLLSQEDKEVYDLEAMREEAEATMGQMAEADISYEIGEETINGDNATVAVTVIVRDSESGESQDFTDNLNLVKENGEWKVSLGGAPE